MSSKRTILSLVLILGLAAPLAADWEAGVAAFKAGDLAAAEAAFRTVIDERADWAGGHRMLGQTLVLGGKVEAALPFLERACELGPDDLRSAMILSQTYLQLSRFSEAFKVLDGRDPSSMTPVEEIVFFKTRAVAALRAGLSSAALRDLKQAVALAPDVADLHRLLARTAKSAGNDKLAAEHFARVVKLDPRDARSMRSWVRLRYAAALDDDERSKTLCRNLVPHARNLVQLDESYEHLVLLAHTSICAGLDEVTKETLLLAVEAGPEDWWPVYTLGGLDSRQERWADAEAALQRALRLSVPVNKAPMIRSKLGYVYEKQERLEEALDQYRLASDTAGVERVQKNLLAMQEEAHIKKLREEARRIEKEIAALGQSDH